MRYQVEGPWIIGQPNRAKANCPPDSLVTWTLESGNATLSAGIGPEIDITPLDEEVAIVKVECCPEN